MTPAENINISKNILSFDGIDIHCKTYCDEDLNHLLNECKERKINIDDYVLRKNGTYNIQRLCILWLLNSILGEGVKLSHSITGAPTLVGNNLNISISHTSGIVVVALSQQQNIGVDIEPVTPRVTKVINRIIGEDELNMVSGENDAQNTTIWCIKEAVYKAALVSGVDFSKDIIISHGANANSWTAKVFHSGTQDNFDVVTSKLFGYICAVARKSPSNI